VGVEVAAGVEDVEAGAGVVVEFAGSDRMGSTG